MIFILVLILCLSQYGSLETFNEEKEVARYLELLKNRTLEAHRFVLPTDNRKYFGNSVPDEVQAEEFGEFDFIIVGAGSSGSVIFNRLSKVPHWKILLLEAGGSEDDFSDIPSMVFFSHFSEMNWGYKTTSQKKSCLGMVDNQCSYPRGRVIGGSGTINALMYIRGNKNDFDKWEKQGNPGWSYKDVLPYFKKSEHFDIEDGDIGYHSRSGLLNVSYVKPAEPITQYFLDANKDMGYEYVDYNGKNQMGYSRIHLNTNKGKRVSGGRSFIDAVRNQPNVKIIKNALVTKVLINKSNSTYGVNFLKNKKLYRATVLKEVILSAGAINTPQLLMLSGIGPRKHLEDLKIPVIKDLPVGKHFQDHPVFPALTIRTNITFRKPPMETLVKQYLQGTGLLTYCANTQGIKFVNTLDPKCTVPDIEFIFVPPPNTIELGQKVFNYKPKIAESLSKIQNGTSDLKIFVLLLHPKSKGSITLKSNNPLDFPNVNTNFFSDKNDEDVEAIYRGILHALTMVDTDAFKKLNATVKLEFDFCNQHQLYSREYWHCAIRHLSSTLYHSSGTTRMGRKTKTSVVNHELKVHGISNLRVGDCGIIPSTTSGHTNAPAFMIGEKLADLLRQTHLS